MKTRYDKLIRDNIPHILIEKNIVAEIRTLEDHEFLAYVKKKIVEEAQEVQESKNREGGLKECADLIEILECFMNIHDISWNQINNARKQKNEERGAFTKKLLLIETEKV